VLTLDRAVSLLDYEDFARSFPGLVKALATWIPHSPARGVLLSVAARRGMQVTGETRRDLARSLHRFGDPTMPIRVEPAFPVTFRVRASIKCREEALPAVVLAGVEAALRDRFSFDARALGQLVSVDEVLATIQGVPGVLAVDLDHLYRQVPGETPAWNARLAAALPEITPAGAVTPAEILSLDPAPLELGVMA
jgi:hypothetical protein